jgi:6-pyruvoyltetrahydropterin/6-carboxytetrahydropterin synthase
MITLRRSFSCAHFYRQPAWDEKKNREVFGKCFTEYGHGHDYQLEATFSSCDEGGAHATNFKAAHDTALLKILNSLLDSLIKTLDHQHLNFTIPEFTSTSTSAPTVPTTENLALYLQDKICSALQSTKCLSFLQQLRLYERSDLWVELQTGSYSE